MPTLCRNEFCTGCAACLAACAHEAITFVKDKYGFAYPQIDNTKCVECKLCESRCPSIRPTRYESPKRTFACHASSESKRLASSSGGIAQLLAESIVEEGGVVYGCAFVPPMSVRHIRCSTLADVNLLRGSKYVQSEIWHIIPQLRTDIKQGLPVLFIGTPCQVAAVKQNFNRYDNLFLIDLVCHGVPSLKMLCDTLPKKVMNAEKDTMEFRACTKFHFSLRNGISVVYDRPLHRDNFLKGFFTGILFRPSCFHCQYSQKQRVSDITIGDFWGLKSSTIADKGKGVSLALINTKKGDSLFKEITGKMICEEHTLEEALRENAQLNYPFHRNFRERVFKSLYLRLGYNAALFWTMPDRIIGSRLMFFIKSKLL